MKWLFNLIIGVGLLTTLYFQVDTHVFLMFMFPILGLLTWVFTINSYQESTKNQSMQMYHLIPVSRNSKFFSKQFFTLFAYPLVLIVTTAIFIWVIRIFVNTPDIFKESYSTPNVPNSVNLTVKYVLPLWIFGHSISTFFAIIFKKNKILYAILVHFCFQFLLSIFLIAFFTGGKNPGTFFSQNIAGQNMEAWIAAGALLVSAIFYGISYHLFFRRQL
jgi:hypothetical protein